MASLPRSDPGPADKAIEAMGRSIDQLLTIVERHSLHSERDLPRSLGNLRRRVMLRQPAVVVLSASHKQQRGVVENWLGTSLANVGIPETGEIPTHLCYGKDSEYELTLKSGHVARLPRKHLAGFFAETPCKELQRMVVRIPNEVLADGTTLVLTPGLRDTNSDNVQCTWKALAEADACIFVGSAKEALDPTVLEAVRKNRASCDKFFFLLDCPEGAGEFHQQQAIKQVSAALQERCGWGKPRVSLQVSGSTAEAGLQWRTRMEGFERDVLETARLQWQIGTMHQLEELTALTMLRAEDALAQAKTSSVNRQVRGIALRSSMGQLQQTQRELKLMETAIQNSLKKYLPPEPVAVQAATLADATAAAVAGAAGKPEQNVRHSAVPASTISPSAIAGQIGGSKAPHAAEQGSENLEQHESVLKLATALLAIERRKEKQGAAVPTDGAEGTGVKNSDSKTPRPLDGPTQGNTKSSNHSLAAASAAMAAALAEVSTPRTRSRDEGRAAMEPGALVSKTATPAAAVLTTEAPASVAETKAAGEGTSPVVTRRFWQRRPRIGVAPGVAAVAATSFALFFAAHQGRSHHSAASSGIANPAATSKLPLQTAGMEPELTAKPSPFAADGGEASLLETDTPSDYPVVAESATPRVAHHHRSAIGRLEPANLPVPESKQAQKGPATFRGELAHLAGAPPRAVASLFRPMFGIFKKPGTKPCR